MIVIVTVKMCGPAGEHRLSREDGAHHQSLPHPPQSLVSDLQSVQAEDRCLHPGELFLPFYAIEITLE